MPGTLRVHQNIAFRDVRGRLHQPYRLTAVVMGDAEPHRWWAHGVGLGDRCVEVAQEEAARLLAEWGRIAP